VLIIGDSFAPGLVQFLQYSFDKVVTDRHFVLDKIVALQPALVIDERVERYLMNW